jgi:hypothetical protein
MSVVVNDHNNEQKLDMLLHLPLHVCKMHGEESFWWCFGFIVLYQCIPKFPFALFVACAHFCRPWCTICVMTFTYERA